MRILVISSCTGEKAVEVENPLTLADFKADQQVLKERMQELGLLGLPAQELYTGQQHLRLIKGIKEVTEKKEIALDFYILSAGYGLIPAANNVLPYDVTFANMNKRELKGWSNQLQIPSSFRRLVAEAYDLILILLGDKYLEACQIDTSVSFGGPTLLFCGNGAAKKLPQLENLKVVPLSNGEAKGFSCPLISIKGELGTRILRKIVTSGGSFINQLFDSPSPLSLLEEAAPAIKKAKKVPIANPEVDKVIDLPPSWKRSEHKSKLRYFIPEWDDLVDPNYDFINDLHSGGSGDWCNEVYAHQVFDRPNYDGILISKVVAEKKAKKKELINLLGVHRYCRVPRAFPIMGDSGAFGYIMEEKPPYATDEILNYYTRLDFDYGVSIDHLIVGATMEFAKERYQLTIQNADDFLREHKKLDLNWRPIGAVQGWDPESYAKAAEQYIKMGYDYIGLGGLVRTPTKEMLKIVEAVTDVVPKGVDIHVFGLARLNALRTFSSMGVTSIDSASHLRRAWLGSNDNYWTLDGNRYAAIRIPEGGKSFRAKRMVKDGGPTVDYILNLEKQCLNAVRNYDKGLLGIEDTLDTLEAYDQLIGEDRKSMRSQYERTLLEKPWKKCLCSICEKEGVEVIIFRGNNRNRRRGFHNTYVFYAYLKAMMTNPDFFINEKHRLFELFKVDAEDQLTLFEE
jgi:queuine/archaeosine tRNA-ribosyltransferase